jgi:hypothetical protein
MKNLKLLKKDLYKKYKIDNFSIKSLKLTSKTLFIIEINSLQYKVINKAELYSYIDAIPDVNPSKMFLLKEITKETWRKTLFDKNHNFLSNELKKYPFCSQIIYDTEFFYLCEYFPEYVQLQNKHFLLENKYLYLKYLIFGEKIITLDIIKNSKLYKNISNDILSIIKNEEEADHKLNEKFNANFKNRWNKLEWIPKGNISIIPNTINIIRMINGFFMKNEKHKNIMVKIENNKIIDWKITDIEFFPMPMPINDITNIV